MSVAHALLVNTVGLMLVIVMLVLLASIVESALLVAQYAVPARIAQVALLSASHAIRVNIVHWEPVHVHHAHLDILVILDLAVAPLVMQVSIVQMVAPHA